MAYVKNVTNNLIIVMINVKIHAGRKKNKKDILINGKVIGESAIPEQNELKLIITELSNIIWNYAGHGEKMTKESIIDSIKKIVDDYNATHDKKINY